jgi:signal transduction histidine kinase
MSLSRLKWVAIVAPLVFIVGVYWLIHTVFYELHFWPGIVVLFVIIAAGVGGFSFMMFGLIERLERRIVEQNEQLSALLAVGRAASSSFQLADMLDASLRAVLAVSSAEAAEVWLVDRGDLALERQLGLDTGALGQRTRLRYGEGLPGTAAANRSPVVAHDLAADPRCGRPEMVARGFRTYCALPLVRAGETVGVLAVAARDAGALSDVELRLLEGVGEQMAVAIENARLHGRVLDGAVLEERERIAHELHDGMAQVLGFVNAQALAIKKLVMSGRIPDALEQVNEIASVARSQYADVRGSILGLRTTRRGLGPSLEAYVAELNRLSGPRIELALDPDLDDVALAPPVELQLVRIVQEALTNVRKHAGATKVTVTARLDETGLAVEVADDGRGFDLGRPPRTGWPHFGLDTMRERAGAVGALLEVSSRPRRGTRVTVRMPVETAAEVAHASTAR